MLYLMIMRTIMSAARTKVALKMNRSLPCVEEVEEVEAGGALWRLEKRVFTCDVIEQSRERAEGRRIGMEKNAMKGQR